jgi:hypothetical protein
MNGWGILQERLTEESRLFNNALQSSRITQHNTLLEILSVNSQSKFGKRHSFRSIQSVDDFRDRIPVQTYDDIAPSIERLIKGEANEIVAAPVEIFERTSGSTKAAKIVPYTAHSLRAFQRAVFPWISNLIAAYPELALGRSYWAISPAGRPQQRTASGVPIGMRNDAAYLGDAAEPFAQLMIGSPELAQVSDIDQWRYLTLRYLLDADDLTLISIWSPTFLFPLLEFLEEHRDQLIRDVKQGEVSFSDLSQYCQHHFKPKPQRALEIEQALSGTQIDTQQLWPKLKLISCWTSAGARHFAESLHRQFPHVQMQGKGLLATEGAVTIPLSSYEHPVLAIRSAFFEFIDSHGNSRLCDELMVDELYQVVMTTYGGLYRYNLGDCVRLRGWAKQTPQLEFVGRAGLVSDLCGEKLTEDFVALRITMCNGFAMLAPSTKSVPHYTLFLDAEQHSVSQASELAIRLDELLGDNPQYAHARRLRQLGPVRARRVAHPLKCYEMEALGCGQRLGDIKPAVLRSEVDWDDRFTAWSDKLMAETVDHRIQDHIFA